MCGELDQFLVRGAKEAGSSPRVRGTRRWGTACHVVLRFIPACAGNSARTNAGVQIVHGSSPRVRGTRRQHPRPHRRERFIPACAGNSRWVNLVNAAGNGSSPRVRGTRQHPTRLRRRMRFIPACAGNSKRCRRRAGAHPVHPRVCGELDRAIRRTCRVDGSSPRVRGTPGTLARGDGAVRFIPACAGNSLAA